ncbi:MAG: hypothetical protein JXR70_03250 [Spirochaetales bacterium]|nr:hypothetical protein [Spirochaetales bacterium]
MANDLEIAKAYFLQASAADVEKKPDIVRSYLNKALDFYSEYSDALFMQYLLDSKNLQQTDIAAGMLNRALSSNTWVYYGAYQAKYEQAKLFLRNKDFEAALKLFNDIENLYKDNPDFYKYLASLYCQWMDKIKCEPLLVSTVKRFPLQGDFYDRLIQFYVSENRVAEARDVLERGIIQLPAETILRLWQARLESDSEKKVNLVKTLIDDGIRLSGVYLLALEVLPEESKQWAALFIDQHYDLSVPLLRDFLAIYHPEDEPWLEKLSQFSGARFNDVNNDGFVEEQWVFDQGRLIKWIRDFDQNGAPEIIIEFESALPRVMTLYKGNQPYQQIDYIDYPFVQKIGLWEGGRFSEYLLLPKAIAFDVVKENESPFSYPWWPDVSFEALGPLARDEFIIFAFEKQEFFSTERSDDTRKIIQYEGGVPVIEKWDYDRNDFYDKIVYFKNGLAETGEIDYDGDKIFECHEVYEKGLLKEIRYDKNRDGFFEWVSKYSSQGKVIEQSWDMTGDGVFDYLQILDGDQQVYRFATAFDGVFDLEIRASKERISEVLRDDKIIPIIASGVPSVFWLQKPGLMPLNGFQEQIGQYRAKGRHFFYFTFNKDIYVEEIE